VVVSFLPLAAGASGDTAAVGLLAQALTATAGRWWEGRHGDRHGHARLLVLAALPAGARERSRHGLGHSRKAR
jgi:hypothetical protein